jgi:excinuclease ABC subunit A
LFEDVRKKGFLKVRVDGEVKDLKEKMQVDRYKIHDIELVVDRLLASDDMKVRLSQSVQKTLQVGKDLMFLLINDDDTVVQYSKQLMCEDTGLSYEEPSPNAFSFNSPYGACPTCKGLGSVYQVSMEAVIPDWSKSIKEGAIAPLGEEREAYIYKQIVQLGKKHKFSVEKPIKDLPQKALNIILYGKEDAEADMEISGDYQALPGDMYTTEYEGIITMLKRWFSGSSSESLRDWVEKFMVLKNCPSCEGARLKKESLWFKVNEKNIAELIQQALHIF